MTAIPFKAPAAITHNADVGLASTALSTSNSVEMKPSVPGNPTLANPVSRKQTARVGRARTVRGSRESESRPNRASRERSVRPKPPSERITENHRQREAVSDRLGMQFQTNQHERRVAQEKMGKKPPGLALNDAIPAA